MEIDARLTFDRVRFDQATDAHLVVSLKAPALDWQVKRPRICVVPVIDISGSMLENQKLEYAKKSVLKLIDHLKDDDYAGIVVFNHEAKVIGKPGKLDSAHRDRLRKAVSEIEAEGYTNFADGMLTALKIVNGMDLAEGIVTRVIMFTDGQANRGPATRIEDVVGLLEKNMGTVTASAFGYGIDASQDFLAEFSRVGKGNYAFVKDPDAALTAFGKELGGLLSTYGTDLVLEVEPQAGHKILSVVTDVDAEEDVVGHLTVRIPELLAEETRHIVLAVKLAEQKANGPRAVNAFNVRVHYDVVDREHHKERKDIEAKGKAQFVKAGEEQTDPNKDLDAIVSLAQVVRAQIAAEEQAKQGKYLDAQKIMAAVASNAASRGHGNTSRLAANVGQRLGNHAVYAASAGYLRGVSTGGTRGMGVSSYDPSALADLEVAGVSLSNSVQVSTSASFAGGNTVNIGGHIPQQVSIGGAPLPPWGNSIVMSAPIEPPMVVGSITGNLVAPQPPKGQEEAKAELRKAIKQAKSKNGKW